MRRGETKPTRLPRWSIATRLTLVATLPSVILFTITMGTLAWASKEQASATIQERARLIALSLASTSQYGLVSGDTSSLERSMRRLIDADRTIVSLEILDGKRQRFAHVTVPRGAVGQVVEREITSDVLSVDLLDNSAQSLHPTSRAARFGESGTIGHVRVALSDEPALVEMARQLVLSLLGGIAVTMMSVVAGLILVHSLRRPLEDSMKAIRGIRQGKFNPQFDTPAEGELGELQDAISEMAANLAERRDELNALVASRTADLEAAMLQVKVSDGERKNLIARSNRQLEDERKRIAVEIHDHLNSTLLGLRAKAEHIGDVAREMQPLSNATLVERQATEIMSTIDELYKSARRLIKQLRPEIIDVLGLPAALREITREYGEINPSCKFNLEIDLGLPDLHGDVSMVVYRVVQEALSNVIKHANATQATVSVIVDPSSWLQVSITDNGVGFDAGERSTATLGLIGMRERVAAVGGFMKIRSERGMVGTEVGFQIPLVLTE